MKPVLNKKLLKDINELYKMFEPFWDEWKQYKYTGLNSFDFYTIELLIKNEFQFERVNKQLLANNYEVLRNVLLKLKTNYVSYQNWVIMRFQFLIINQLGPKRLTTLSNIPISELPIAFELKEVLLKFRGGTIEKLFNSYSESECRKPEVFENLLQYKIKYNQLNQIRDKPKSRIKKKEISKHLIKQTNKQLSIHSK